jgi:hypothetical protein
VILVRSVTGNTTWNNSCESCDTGKCDRFVFAPLKNGLYPKTKSTAIRRRLIQSPVK